MKASLHVDSQVKNTVLQNAETQVINMSQYWTQEGDMIIYYGLMQQVLNADVNVVNNRNLSLFAI